MIERLRAILTPRQIECLAMSIGQDMSQPEIAAAIGIAQPTVHEHLREARARLRSAGLVAPERTTLPAARVPAFTNVDWGVLDEDTIAAVL